MLSQIYIKNALCHNFYLYLNSIASVSPYALNILTNINNRGVISEIALHLPTDKEQNSRKNGFDKD
jgi:hypothetical protein